jgi:NAD(P)H-flavin reductase/hemoglobin-like flavoprotein
VTGQATHPVSPPAPPAPPPAPPGPPPPAGLDPAILRHSFDRVAQFGDAVATHFYSRLFLVYPDTRDMFPASTAAQRDRFVKALVHIVAHVDQINQLVPYVKGLGVDHRKFGVSPEHFEPVGKVLLATLTHFLGEEFTPQVREQWTLAYNTIATVMIDAAADADRAGLPRWWDAQVVDHQRHSPSLVTFTVQPTLPYPYLAGQSVPITTTYHRRLWRNYCPANAPSPDGLITFYVRSVRTGLLSPTLAQRLAPGDWIQLGPPAGHALTLRSRTSTRRPLLLLAGGTGRAPLQALIEQLATEPRPEAEAHGSPVSPVYLVAGARNPQELCRWADLEALATDRHWLTVQAVVDQHFPAHPDAPGWRPVIGRPVEVARERLGDLSGWEIYLCGPPAMVNDSYRQLVDELHVPSDLIHVEDYTTDWYSPSPSADSSEVPA